MMDEKKNRVEELLEEAVRWLRIASAPTIRGWLEPVLTTTKERKVYQASTGVAREEVGKVAGVTGQTVSNYWARWRSAAPPILTAAGEKGRYARLYDLSEISMPIEVSS